LLRNEEERIIVDIMPTKDIAMALKIDGMRKGTAKQSHILL